MDCYRHPFTRAKSVKTHAGFENFVIFKCTVCENSHNVFVFDACRVLFSDSIFTTKCKIMLMRCGKLLGRMKMYFLVMQSENLTELQEQLTRRDTAYLNYFTIVKVQCGRGGSRLAALALILTVATSAVFAEHHSSVDTYPLFRVHKYHGIELHPIQPVPAVATPIHDAPHKSYGVPNSRTDRFPETFNPENEPSPQPTGEKDFQTNLEKKFHSSENTDFPNLDTFQQPIKNPFEEKSSSRSGRATNIGNPNVPGSSGPFFTFSNFGNSPSAASDTPSSTESPNSPDLSILDFGIGDSDAPDPFAVLDSVSLLSNYFPTGDGKSPLRASIRITGPREVQIYPKIKTSPIRVDITSHEGPTKPPPVESRRDVGEKGKQIVKRTLIDVPKGIGLGDVKSNLAAKVIKDTVKDIAFGGGHPPLINPLKLLPPPPKPLITPKEIGQNIADRAVKQIVKNKVKNILFGGPLHPAISLQKLTLPTPHLSPLFNVESSKFDIKNVGKSLVRKVVKDTVKDVVFSGLSPIHSPKISLPLPIKFESPKFSFKTIPQNLAKKVIKDALFGGGLGGISLPHPLNLFKNQVSFWKNPFSVKHIVQGLAKGVVRDLVKDIFIPKPSFGKILPLGLLKGNQVKLNPIHIMLAKLLVDNQLRHPSARLSLFNLLKHPLFEGKFNIHPIHLIVAKNLFENLLKDSSFQKLLTIKPKVATLLFATKLLSSPIFALSNVAKLLTLTKINAIRGGLFEKVLLKKVAFILALSGKVAAVKASLLSIPIILADIVGKKLKSIKLAASVIPLALHALLSLHPLAFHLITHPILNKLPLAAKLAILKYKSLTNLHLALIVAFLAHPALAKLVVPLLAVIFKYQALVKLPLLPLIPVLKNPLAVKLLLAGLTKKTGVIGATAGAATAVPIALLKDPVLSKLPVSVLAAFAKHKALLTKLPLSVLIAILKTSVGAKLLVPLLVVFAIFPKLSTLPLPILIPIFKDPKLTSLLLAIAAAVGGKAGGLAGVGTAAATIAAKKPFALLSKLISFAGGKVASGLGAVSTVAGLASLAGAKTPLKIAGFDSDASLGGAFASAIGGALNGGFSANEESSILQPKKQFAALGSPYVKLKFPRPEVYIETLIHPRRTTTTPKPYPNSPYSSYELPKEHRESPTTYGAPSTESTIPLPESTYGPPENNPYPSPQSTYGPPSSEPPITETYTEYGPPIGPYPPESEEKPYPPQQYPYPPPSYGLPDPQPVTESAPYPPAYVEKPYPPPQYPYAPPLSESPPTEPPKEYGTQVKDESRGQYSTTQDSPYPPKTPVDSYGLPTTSYGSPDNNNGNGATSQDSYPPYYQSQGNVYNSQNPSGIVSQTSAADTFVNNGYAPPATYGVPPVRGDIQQSTLPDASGFAIPDSMIRDLFNLYSTPDTFSNPQSVRPSAGEYNTFRYNTGSQASSFSNSNYSPYPAPQQGPYPASPARSFDESDSDPYDEAAASSNQEPISVLPPQEKARRIEGNRNAEVKDMADPMITRGGYSRVQVQPVVSRHLQSKSTATTLKESSPTGDVDLAMASARNADVTVEPATNPSALVSDFEKSLGAKSEHGVVNEMTVEPATPVSIASHDEAHEDAENEQTRATAPAA